MRLQKTLTSAQLLALYTTPVQIIPAPETSGEVDSTKANVIKSVKATLSAGTAYDGVAAGENLVLSYTDASGQVIQTFETDGFLTLAAGAKTINKPNVNPLLITAGAAVVAHILSGNIATGTGTLTFDIEYDIVVL